MNRLNQNQTQWTQIILGVVGLLITVLLTQIIWQINFTSEINHFVWLIIAIFLVVIILSVAKFYNIYFRKINDVKNLRSGLLIILILGSVTLFIGIYGYFVELFEAASRGGYSGLFGVVTTVIDANNKIFFSGIERVMKSTSLAMVSVYVTLVTALIWFALVNKIKNLEQKK